MPSSMMSDWEQPTNGPGSVQEASPVSCDLAALKESPIISWKRRLLPTAALGLVTVLVLSFTLGILLSNNQENGSSTTKLTTDKDVSFVKSATLVISGRNRKQANYVLELSCPTELETSMEFTLENHPETKSIIAKQTPNMNYWIQLTNAPPDSLCTLVQVGNTSEGSFILPMARSYSGHQWEVSAGKYKDYLQVSDCRGDQCRFNLNVVEQPTEAVFHLTTFGRPNYTARDEAARFLEQSTFGPTTDLIDAMTDDDGTVDLLSKMARWIDVQMNQVPIFSHRALYRRHLNARFPVPSPMGTVTHPCNAGTRYRRVAFSEKDTAATLDLTHTEDGRQIVLSVNGQVRTVVDAPLFTWSPEINNVLELKWPEGSHRICYVYYDGERVGLAVEHPDHGQECMIMLFADPNYNIWYTKYWANPPIGNMETMAEFHPSLTLLNIPMEAASVVDEALFPVPEEMPDQLQIILLADLDDADCAKLKPEHEVFAFWNDNYYIHDPRFELRDNSMENPLPDGGGSIAGQEGPLPLEHFSTLCANAPRTFLNEKQCILSNHPQACRYRTKEEEYDGPEVSFEVSPEAIRAINDASRDTATPVYVYAIDGLDLNRDTAVASPCTPGEPSRWINVLCSDVDEGVSDATRKLMSEFLEWLDPGENGTPPLRDIWHPVRFERACDPSDVDLKGFEVPDNKRQGRCWRNVHPDHLNVYDFSSWVDSHPGNSDTRNPIREVAEFGNTTLLFPSWHEMSRWQNSKEEFPGPVPLGHPFNFFQLPVRLRTKEIASALGIDLESASAASSNGESRSTVVCGSPFEVANDPFLGGSTWGGWTFDAVTQYLQTSYGDDLTSQRQAVWTKAALEDPGQLRQRVAWALSQILVISPGSIADAEEMTEPFLVFYDIMVRNAFGNYRDILKEVSYSPMMADMLTYYEGRSTAHVWEHEGNIEFADENYAREIMQLFTTGAFARLHRNGTAMLNDVGEHERVYSNDDIEEYARAWTGFVSHAGRGNSELFWKNRIDPMRIDEEWRDRHPKMGLDRSYIGDGYPLCSDLPDKHFLVEGASYKLLGSQPIPELQVDPLEWSSEESVRWLVLEPGSSLYAKLCASTNGSGCLFPSIVVLDETIECTGQECAVDTIRTVRIDGLFYEYARKPCVHQAFFEQAKIVVPRWDWHNIMCADPRTESGSVACCTGSDWSLDEWDEEYFGERVSFATALERCGGVDNICSGLRRPSCDSDLIGVRCHGNNYFWTSNSCKLRAKIDKQRGKVGIVHEPPLNKTASIVHADTKTFFRVDWDGDFQEIVFNCTTLDSCVETEDDACLCDVSVVEEQIYFGSSLPSPDDALSGLRIGAFEQLSSIIAAGAEGIDAYNLAADGHLLAESVFAVVDKFGRRHLRKNVKSSVVIVGTEISFRNPVHFISLSDPEPRDAHYETDATLDHYMYHPNTAPFLAIRFAQRFGISNPSPRYVEAIATAFITGSYAFSEKNGETLNFGSGEYGDLASTFACVLLDREARNVLLDSDPAHGSFKEPLLKVVGLMRALEFKSNEEHPWVKLDINFGDRIGQMAHEIPSVFSFFLPEYQPAGPVAKGSLVAPEAQVLTGPRVIDSLNGIFSMLKYDLTECLGGFGHPKEGVDCDMVSLQSFKNTGELTYMPDAEAYDSPERVVNELATLLTAGRLGLQNRRLIEQVYLESEIHGLVAAQQLMVAAPEFHITNLVRQSGDKRPSIPTVAASSKPYKAVVYLLLQGGVDSFNMLAPHTCSAVNSNGMTLLEQYNEERTTIAFTEEERYRIIDAAGQPCEQFAIHQDLPLIERLYNDGDLSFFANVGQLDMPVTKDTYFMSKTDLFAHNTMQRQAQRIDPWEKTPSSGILGRMCDVLLPNGYTCQSITIDDATVATVGGIPGTSVSPLIVSGRGLDKFAPNSANETLDLNDYVASLNEATKLHSSVFGETWSQTLQRAIADAELLTDAIRSVKLTQNYSNVDSDDRDHIKKIKALSSLMLTHETRGTDRDVFFLSLGDWDHHEALKPSLSLQFSYLNEALTLLEGELKAQGLWDQVCLVATSEFSRTLTANSGEGSDHAWGGHYFILGGSVKGGQILGDYPADVTMDGPLNVGRGRLIPTLSWESMLNGVIAWMGLDGEDDLDYCMPNRKQTGTTLFRMDDVFESSSDSTSF